MKPEGIRCDHRILHDLGMYGDDAEEMIVEVADVVGLNPAEFDFCEVLLLRGFCILVPSTNPEKARARRQEPSDSRRLVELRVDWKMANVTPTRADSLGFQRQ